MTNYKIMKHEEMYVYDNRNQADDVCRNLNSNAPDTVFFDVKVDEE